MSVWTCWLVWSGSSVALTVLLLPLLRPRGHAFAAGLVLRTAGSERGLLQASARPLAQLPAARSGALHLDASGDPLRSARGAAVTLIAGRGGSVHIQGAGLERSPRAGRPWQPAPSGEPMQTGARYRVGDLYLRLD